MKVKDFKDLLVWQKAKVLTLIIYKETKNFPLLYVALGSAVELETQLMISKELGYLETDAFDIFIAKLKEVQKMLNGLINSLRVRSKK